MPGRPDPAAALREQFPGWTLWVSGTGRWWASRTVELTAAQVAAGCVPFLHADDPWTLTGQIRAQGAARRRSVRPTGRRRTRNLAAVETLTDDGTTMRLSDQTLVEFAVLTLTGIVVPAVGALLVTDYRGFLTSYAHKCWRFYQRPWYPRLFLWTSSSRARYADEARVPA